MSKWEIETMLKALKEAKLSLIKKQMALNEVDDFIMIDYDDFVKMEERLETLLSESDNNVF